MKLLISRTILGATLTVTISMISGLTTSSAGVPLPPGAALPTPAGKVGLSLGSLGAPLATLFSPFNSSSYGANPQLNISGPIFSGIVETRVFNDVGGLTFAYQLDNITTSQTNFGTGPIARSFINALELSGYQGSLITDAGYESPDTLIGAGTVGTSDAGRTNDGNTVQFLFTGDGVGNSLTQAEANANTDLSHWLFVHTNSATYVTSVGTAIGAVSQTFGILAPVPEPATVLFGLALFGVIGAGGRRRAAKTEQVAA